MRKPSSSPLHRVLGRLDNLDTVNLQNLVQRLARERALLEAVFDTIREGILVINAEGTIDYANAAALRLTGLKEDDVAQLSLWKLLPGLAQTMDPDVVTGGGAGPEIITREFELRYPEPRFVRLYMVPFRSGDEVRWAAILSDITKEKASTHELIESEKLNSIFLLAAGVAHEIGNPLNSLTIHLQLIERQLSRSRRGSATDKVAASVRICREEVTRLDGIIRHFLEAIRPQPVDYRDVDLVALVEDVLRFLGHELADRQIALEVEAPGERPPVAGDPNQIKQVCFNLVKNAMEAMAPGGRLRIRARVDDDSFHLLFADTGSGIKRDDLAKVFTPFHTTKKTGHGLGLIIVERIMRAHGGHVGLDSKEGVGTIVSLQFPLKHRRVRMLGEGASA